VEELEDAAESVLRGSSWSMLSVDSLVTFLWSTRRLISFPVARLPRVVDLDLGGRGGGGIDQASMPFMASLPVVTAMGSAVVASVAALPSAEA
jgi:hypothetical protein